MAEDSITLYVAGSCPPCQNVKKLVKEGRINVKDVKVIDVETKEGFPYIEKMGLGKVPTAMKGSQVCELSIKEGSLVVSCPNGEPSPA